MYQKFIQLGLWAWLVVSVCFAAWIWRSVPALVFLVFLSFFFEIEFFCELNQIVKQIFGLWARNKNKNCRMKNYRLFNNDRDCAVNKNSFVHFIEPLPLTGYQFFINHTNISWIIWICVRSFDSFFLSSFWCFKLPIKIDILESYVCITVTVPMLVVAILTPFQNQSMKKM